MTVSGLKPHTLEDLDRYGPVVKLPLPLTSQVWAGADFTAADRAALQDHFRKEVVPLIEATCADDPAHYLEILAGLQPHLFDAPKQQ
jgi:hypothetical protein